MRRAVFLDRDGVIIADTHLLTEFAQIQLLPGVAPALQHLADDGFKLIVVSNQTVVARGLATEIQVQAINTEIQRQLKQAGGPTLDAFFICPHHPQATLPAYRLNCACRKPKPGLLLTAATEFNLNLTACFMIGDRMTDIMAGVKAGCRTIWLQTGMHTAPPIETTEPLDVTIQPDYICNNLQQAADWIFNLK